MQNLRAPLLNPLSLAAGPLPRLLWAGVLLAGLWAAVAWALTK